MREISVDHGKFKFSESIKELTIDRFSEFQKYILQDAGMGSDIDAVYKHFEKLDVFLAAGKLEEAIRERSNQHYALFFMLNKINITSLSFAVLLYSIDDVRVEDYSETNLLRICERLGRDGLSRGELESLLEDVKKNLIRN